MIKEYILNKLTDKQKELLNIESDVAQRFLAQLDHNLMNNVPTIGLPYWAEQDPIFIRDFTFVAQKLALGKSRVRRNFSEFEFDTALLDKSKIPAWRENQKLEQFMMRCDIHQYPSDLVKVNGKAIRTGLNRAGFAKVAKNEFQLDLDKLAEYYRPIKMNLIKSIRVGIENGKIKDKFFADEANYRRIVDQVLQYYMASPTMKYNLEKNVSDQRGRSIFKALKRIGNPISSKDFRALLVVPGFHPMVKTDLNKLDDIFYFVAELCGAKSLTEAEKIETGRQFYKEKHLPRLDLKSEDDRKDLHELIWLERIYNKLDFLFKTGRTNWNIPLEIDAGMSIAQVVGALTNDVRLLESTNVVGTKLSDPWHIEGVRRLSAKAVGTPTFYGSSRSAVALIKDKGIAVDKTEINLIRREFASGRFAIMKQFKDALIKNYSVHNPIIPIKIFNDEFNIYVNKWKPAGTTIQVTEAFDQSNKFRYSYTHKQILVPDYARMKLFWATCLVHNLDSQIMNKVALIHQLEWLLTIHDAIIGLPGALRQMRHTYARLLKEVNEHRFSIINEYRKSIGATSMKSDVAFYKLHISTVQAEDTEFNATAMK